MSHCQLDVIYSALPSSWDTNQAAGTRGAAASRAAAALTAATQACKLLLQVLVARKKDELRGFLSLSRPRNIFCLNAFLLTPA